MVIEGMHYNENCECKSCKRVSGKPKQIGPTSIAQAEQETLNKAKQALCNVYSTNKDGYPNLRQVLSAVDNLTVGEINIKE